MNSKQSPIRAGSSHTEAPVVLWSVTPDQTSSPYIRDVAEALEALGWPVRPMTLRRLLVESHAIVHVQWPEHVSRGPGVARTIAKHVRAAAILAALRIRRHRVVLTAHNRSPHGESDMIDAAFRRGIQRLADATVVLVAGHVELLRRDGAIRSGSTVVTIPHPVQRLTNAVGLKPADQRDHLLFLGQIHPYHQIYEFVQALDRAGSTRPVVIAGGVGDDGLVDELESFASSRDWLTIISGYVPDDRLEPILASTVAIVSLQTTPFNSGGPYYALPRGLPAVLTAGAQADELAESVGAEWVFAVPEDVHTLDVSLFEDWLGLPRSTPVLEQFEAERVAREHIGLYELLRS